MAKQQILCETGLPDSGHWYDINSIANSDKTVYHLDNGTIKALLYENEYSIGYLGIYQLLSNTKMDYDDLSKMIEYRVVEKQNMYSTFNQKMLFPFVK